VAESPVALPPASQSRSAIAIVSALPHDFEVPRPACPTCGGQMLVIMAPPPPTADLNEDWLFKCSVCNVIVPVAQT
jgi:hypothetical protein